ncbi:hypothetical protein KPH14_001392, partial [Odynerus spinipes]
MPDGTIYSFNRVKITFKLGAVPTLHKNESNISEVLLENPRIIAEGALVDKKALRTDTKTSESSLERFSITDHQNSPAIVLCYLDYKTFNIKFRVKINANLKIMIVVDIKLRKQLHNRLYKPTISNNTRYEGIKPQLCSEKKKCKSLTNKNETLKQKIHEERLKCAGGKEFVIEKEMYNLPPIQQETVRACFFAAKAKDTKQRRYTVEW